MFALVQVVAVSSVIAATVQVGMNLGGNLLDVSELGGTLWAKTVLFVALFGMKNVSADRKESNMTIAVGDHLFIGRTLVSTEQKGTEGHTEYEVLKVEYGSVVKVELKPVK